MFDTVATTIEPDRQDPLERLASLGSLDAGGTLDAAVAARARAQAAEVELVELAAHWADLHGELRRGPGPVLPGCERLVRLGGEGTPRVAEFAPTELGCELGLSGYAADALVADALDLRHRLPRVWARSRSGRLAVWVARRVAEETRAVPAAAVAAVDARVAAWGEGFAWSRLRRVVQAAVAAAEPAPGPAGDLGVWVSPSEASTKEVFVRTDPASAIWFDAALERVADALALLGDGRARQLRRAAAVGILAHPQQALDLVADAERATAEVATGSETSGAAGSGLPVAPVPGETSRRRRRRGLRAAATVYVHLTDATLAAGSVARVQGAAPMLARRLAELLGHADVTLTPVLDLAGQAPVDAYEVPDSMRAAVRLRSPADAFPYGVSVRDSLDLDHTEAYLAPDRGGGPGQTRTANLAPLTRFHHRVKTFGGWSVAQPFDGILVWRSPHGRHYLVDHTGTHRLG